MVLSLCPRFCAHIWVSTGFPRRNSRMDVTSTKRPERKALLGIPKWLPDRGRWLMGAPFEWCPRSMVRTGQGRLQSYRIVNKQVMRLTEIPQADGRDFLRRANR